MPAVHKLFASHTKLELAAVAKDNDIYLALNQTGTDHEPVQMMFSKCCPISTRKPWAFETQRFQTVSLDASDDHLDLLGRNEYLETQAVVSFQQGLLFIDLTWRCVAQLPLDHAAVGFCLDMHYDLATERLTLPDSIYKRPPYYLFGWAGQSIRLAWCSAQMGLTQNNPEWILRARQAVDFYVANSQTPMAGLRYNQYYTQERRWCGKKTTPIDMISSRAHGEATANLGKMIRLFQSAHQKVPKDWIYSLKATADFLLLSGAQTAEGIFPIFWQDNGAPVSDVSSAAGISCVLAMIEAYKQCDDRKYLEGAMHILFHYWHQGGDRFDHPFARATLDARCEDKEAGIYFFLAAVELFYATSDARFKEWAEAAADWIITFVYFWHTGFRPKTICAQNGFITTGWPGVSVQNHHLDVFFPAYELYEFGRHIGNAMYQHIGRMVFQAWSHGICRTPGDWGFRIPGEQGEQFF